jgi:hypothetical protein
MTPTPELYITAQRHFRVGTLDADNAAPVSHATTVRIERAFLDGQAAGLLHLVTQEIKTSLPPRLAFARGVAQRYVAELCHLGVPLFREQIRCGGPVSVAHPQLVRCFMTIPEAAQLGIQAGSMATGGDVFVLDMGPPVRIEDLARRMISLMGLTVRDSDHPDGDIEIHYTGLRSAEKLFEEPPKRAALVPPAPALAGAGIR